MASDVNERLRALPQISQLMQDAGMIRLAEKYGPVRTTDAARETVDSLRRTILADPDADPDTSLPLVVARTEARLEDASKMHFQPVINATGVILHTNLGRAPLAPRTAEALAGVLTGYTTLEYDIGTGQRGRRESAVESRLTALTGAEAALVVNNNAAAVLLMLSALAVGRDVVVSRGELVEIGGAFRIPDVMEAGGARLVAVGTTNKTHRFDYERAIGAETACILKVHTSNYRIVGFTGDVELDELAAIAARHGLPLVYDLGSGSLFNLSAYGIEDEPTVKDALDAGADLVCFSGDKLLGGPQAGIIVGKKDMIDLLRRHPLMRALRVGKFTLAALELTLDACADKVTAEASVPILSMLARTKTELEAEANRLCRELADDGIEAFVRDSEGRVGGGSAPLAALPSAAVVLRPPAGRTAAECAEALRLLALPVVGRIEDEALWFDLRTVFERELDDLLAALRFVWKGEKHA